MHSGFAIVDGLREHAEPDLAARARRLFYASPLYQATLAGRAPRRILGTPPQLRPGNPILGQEILDGHLRYAGRQILFGRGRDPGTGFSDELASHVHGFAWLGDLRALGSTDARTQARGAVTDWMSGYGRWQPVAWRPDVLADRLVNWITHYGFYGASGNEEFQRLWLKSVGRQVQHLARTAARQSTGMERIVAAKGMIYAGVSLAGCDKHLAAGLELLAEELERQLLPDGGHVGRSPAIQAKCLEHLVVVRQTLQAAHVDVPEVFSEGIKRMVPLLRAFRHGDGNLAQFNGGPPVSSDEIDAVLAAAGVRAQAAQSAPHSGFHRLTAGNTVIVMDTGFPPGRQANRWSHAGTLSFEMSVGKERLVVNCGAETSGDADWRRALRSTAAHSTLVVDDTNSSELDDHGGFARPARNVSASRREVDGSVILEASHDGYVEPFGLTHRRLLMLSPDGKDVRGEDNLIGAGGDAVALRFHLHPSVHASVIQNGRSVLLKLRRNGWRFDVADATVDIRDSVYRGEFDRPRRCSQIVVEDSLSGAGTTISWRFSKIGG